MDSFLFILCSLTIATGTIATYKWYHASRFPLPPGPPSKFISGNIHQLPQNTLWITYANWSKIYGPVISLRIYNRRIIVLNNAKSALDLLESRAGNYADRPRLVMFQELAGRGDSLFQIPHSGPYHKIYRKMVQTALNPRAVLDYRPLQEQERRTMLQGLAKSPENYEAHLRRNAGGVILKVAYGWTVADVGDYLVSLMEEAYGLQAYLTRPGRWLVEHLPFMRFIPSWFPGAYFKREALRCRKRFEIIEKIPFEWVKKQMASGSYIESFVSRNLQREDGKPLSQEEETALVWSSDALYTGGADTTNSAMCTLLLALAINPDVQSRAQAEIDAVVGRNRLPGYEDEERLVYINAVVKELLRWAPVVPLGLSHKATEEDEYNGYRIPKGATVYANIWAITHDNETYPNPESFDPTRFLGKEPQTDPRKFVFGYGRRVCPGAHLAERSLFFNVAGILAMFDIALAPQHKEPIGFGPSSMPFVTAVTTRPEGFSYKITPRSQEMLDLITDME